MRPAVVRGPRSALALTLLVCVLLGQASWVGGVVTGGGVTVLADPEQEDADGEKMADAEEKKHEPVRYTAEQEQRMARGESPEQAPGFSALEPPSQAEPASDEKTKRQNKEGQAVKLTADQNERVHKMRLKVHNELMKEQFEDEKAYKHRHGSVELYTKAEAYMYPGNGRMSAEDVKSLNAPIHALWAELAVAKSEGSQLDEAVAANVKLTKALENCKHCKPQDSCYEDCSAKINKMKKLFETHLKGKHTEREIEGFVKVAQANLNDCNARILACIPSKFEEAKTNESPTELGESMQTGYPLNEEYVRRLQAVKTTARDDDKIMRGEHDPMVAERAVPAEHVKTTGMQDYAHRQTYTLPESMLDGEPGKRLKHDKLTSNEIGGLTIEANKLINEAEKEDAKETTAARMHMIAENKNAIQAISKSALAAATYQEKLREQTDARNPGMSPKGSPIRVLADTNRNLNACRAEEMKRCRGV